LTKSRCCKKR